MKISLHGPQGPVSPMAQKFSFRPGTGMTRSLRRADAEPQIERFFVNAQNVSGSDFRAAKHGEV